MQQPFPPCFSKVIMFSTCWPEPLRHSPHVHLSGRPSRQRHTSGHCPPVAPHLKVTVQVIAPVADDAAGAQQADRGLGAGAGAAGKPSYRVGAAWKLPHRAGAAWKLPYAHRPLQGERMPMQLWHVLPKLAVIKGRPRVGVMRAPRLTCGWGDRREGRGNRRLLAAFLSYLRA